MSLELRNIKKSFGQKEIISDLSYRFDDVGLYALKGDSGAGKTTLLRIIAGLDSDFDGEVKNQPEKIAFSFQEYRLFPSISAIQNVIFPIFERKNEAVFQKSENILRSLGFCEEEFSLFPNEMSGGMKQRVSVARALVFDSPVLLLDEPTKELDSQNAEVMRELILEESKRRLVILSTHNEKDLSLPGIKIIEI